MRIYFAGGMPRKGVCRETNSDKVSPPRVSSRRSSARAFVMYIQFLFFFQTVKGGLIFKKDVPDKLNGTFLSSEYVLRIIKNGSREGY